MEKQACYWNMDSCWLGIEQAIPNRHVHCFADSTVRTTWQHCFAPPTNYLTQRFVYRINPLWFSLSMHALHDAAPSPLPQVSYITCEGPPHSSFYSKGSIVNKHFHPTPNDWHIAATGEGFIVFAVGIWIRFVRWWGHWCVHSSRGWQTARLSMSLRSGASWGWCRRRWWSCSCHLDFHSVVLLTYYLGKGCETCWLKDQ